MTKWTALTLGLILVGIACICQWVYGQLLLATLSGLLGVAFLLLYQYKDDRDDKIITQAKQEREASLQSQPELPAMVSGHNSRSRQLFVPQPLDHHR